MSDEPNWIMGLAILAILFIVPIVVPSILFGPTRLSAEEISSEWPSWSMRDCERVAAHRVWIGMSRAMARLSLGEPSKVNRSVYSWGTHEQWVYRERPWNYLECYLYFRNGILTSWQD